MYTDTKEIIITAVIEYEYDSELEKIKEIIKQIIDLKKIKEIEIKEK